MAAAVLVHDKGITLASIPQNDSSPSITPLSLPSRFPPTEEPKITVSPSGHSSCSQPTTTSCGSTMRKAADAGGKDTVCVAVKEGGVRVMEKGEGKWKCINTLDGPNNIRRLVADGDARHLLALGSELVLFDQKRGTRKILDVLNIAEVTLESIAFVPTMLKTLLIPSSTSSTLSLFDIASGKSRLIEPFGSKSSQGIGGVAFSPIVREGEKWRGGLCAVCKQGSSEIALVGLDSPNSSKIVDLGEQIKSVAFLDSSSLAATTISGKILVKDLRSHEKDLSVLSVDQPVISTHALPPSTKKASRGSAATESSSARPNRVAMGESKYTDNASNVPSNLISQSSTGGKAKEPQTSDAPRHEISHHPEHKPRSTSMPTAPASRRNEPSLASSRVVSATQIGEMKRCHTARTPGIEEEPEQEPATSKTDQEREAQPTTDAGDVTLSWALNPPAVRRVEGTKDTNEAMDEMRREIGNLQLDLLRMGRSLRNEIRFAVQPLLEEIRENQQVIAQQRKEIERLRAR
ncbi:hypothetical protein DB88DRAFT_547876 [Papiliotrema laurentii]|uniref:Uncharacterized protein n=1 Tax=Papiliotrema laurentii TaxID=5418 RepID=A0AAD9FQB8_PAPLA|nr:hypothetical protein DB88DRAFT_547876 [Papiliotrema laurentii]